MFPEILQGQGKIARYTPQQSTINFLHLAALKHAANRRQRFPILGAQNNTACVTVKPMGIKILCRELFVNQVHQILAVFVPPIWSDQQAGRLVESNKPIVLKQHTKQQRHAKTLTTHLATKKPFYDSGICGIMRPVQTLDLQAEKMAFEGRAIARHGRFVVFLEGALPGERVIARITRRKRHYAYAQTQTVLIPSPHRVEPACAAFPQCGGCTFQNMAYPVQLEMKQAVLLDALRPLPDVQQVMQPILPSPRIFYFRNKMVFAFGRENGQTLLGLHTRGDWQRVVDTRHCLLQSPETSVILNAALNFAQNHNVPVWDDASRTGLLRHLVIREGKHTGERMIHLHAAEIDSTVVALAETLAPFADTVLISAHLNVPEAAPSDTTRVIQGYGVIHERLNDFIFEVGPTTFFQTNTEQAERMFALLTDWVRASHPRLAVDLYAGTGPIAAHLSRVAERVLAAESNPQSVVAARRNFEINGLTNVMIECREIEQQPKGWLPRECDLIVVDPPRPGLHRKALELLLHLAAPTVIYVSCNPATLARDLKLLLAGGYSIERLQPVDLFPHSFHIETLALLRIKDR